MNCNMLKMTISNELYDKYLNPKNVCITPKDTEGHTEVYDYVKKCESLAKTNRQKQNIQTMWCVFTDHNEMMCRKNMF
jgi:hypothetical protein